MSNLKIDIIYYQTSSDFEMEFNLSGCCRMRIFKDKIETKKEFVSALARNVSRSKIIIVVTDLFGSESIVPTLSKSIGLPLISPDKNEFGIKTDENIQMPNTAVPLVTKAGIYGGCIIECGPQSIVIVSSIRSLRHEIMKTYVHNYIFDVGQLFAYQERMGQNATSLTQNDYQNKTQSSQNEHVGAQIVDPSSEESVLPPQPPQEFEAENDDSEELVGSTLITEADTELINQTPQNEETTVDISSVSGNADLTNHDEHKVSPGINDLDDFEIPITNENSEQERINKAKRAKKSRATSIILLILVILLLIGFGILAYYFVYLPSLGVENEIANDSNNIFYELFNLF